MQIPDTENIHFQHAFKKGYSLALEGKSADHMPSAIRRDLEMRSYFQLGWEQAAEDIALSVAESAKPDWRDRFAWGTMMILGGISTTLLMLHNIQEEQAEQTRLIAGNSQHAKISEPPEKFVRKTEMTSLKSAVKQPTESLQATEESLDLLTSAQRSDLAANQEVRQQLTDNLMPLQSLVESDIKVSDAVLTDQIVDRTPNTEFVGSVPKYIRELTFYTQIAHANQQTISHRWRFNEQVLATIPLEIKSDDYRTWSSKKMSSAWQGTWYIEVLDANQDVIYRKSFIYGNP